jgi:hypothetical protein
VKYTAKLIWQQNVFYKADTNYAAEQVDVFRVVMVLYSLFSFITLLLDYPVFFAPDGLINWEVTNASSFWFELHPAKIAGLLGVSGQTVMLTLIYLYLGALLLLLLGLWPKVMTALVLLLFVTFTNVLAPYGYGVDVYHTVSLFFLLLFPAGYYLAIKPKRPSFNTQRLRELSIRALQVYIGLTYLNAGIEKAFMPNWWNGKFIYYLISDPTAVTHNIIPLDLPIPVYAILGISVVLIESLYLFLVWIPVVRTVTVCSIILMHLFIAYCMGLTAFGILLILLNIACWYPAMYKDLKKISGYGKKI